jgi:protein-S-isoprenylcysteine O-methyltransferase Ste14
MSADGFIPILAALAIWLERMREVATKRAVIAGKPKEKLTFTLFMICGLLIIFGGIAEFILRGGKFYWQTLVIGLVLAIGSFVIRRRAIAALGRFWSLHVEVREEHEFIRSGPFAWIRHPVYLSMILEIVAVALILQAWLTLMAVALIFIPTLSYRIKLEEAALAAKFGAAFDDYRRTTPMLFPSPRRHQS